jgi:hypothetical protein
MRRILVLLTVVALMMVMMAMAVGPAFAVNGGASSCANKKGQDLAHRDPISIRVCHGVAPR